MWRCRLESIKNIFGCLCLLVCATAVSHASEPDDRKAVAIVSSKNIGQYMEALGAMEETVSSKTKLETEVFYLDSDSTKIRDVVVERWLEQNDNSVFVAVGPQAAYSLWNDIPVKKENKIFTMVLNPEKFLPEEEGPCGISLNIPADFLVGMIARALPDVGRVGLIFNPEHNNAFADLAVRAGLAAGVTVVPLEVTDRKQIPTVLQNNWQKIQALWIIPDWTVTRRVSLQKYIIKASLEKGVPVIGYNRACYENGASLCYWFDYEDIGRQTGRLLLSLVNGEPCSDSIPHFRVWCNTNDLKKLGIEYNTGDSDLWQIEAGP